MTDSSLILKYRWTLVAALLAAVVVAALAVRGWRGPQGPSGSGKSTLLNIVGLLDRPTAGTLAVCGEETTHNGRPRIDAAARPQHRLRVPVPSDHRVQRS